MDSTPPIPGSVPPQIPAQKSNAGKWVLFGCGGCLGLLALGVVAFAAIFYFAMGVIKNTDVYADAFKKAEQSAEVQAALGTPIETGFMFQGNVSITNGAGTADITVPLSGPKGEGTMKVKASKSPGGPWQYSVLEVQLSDGNKVDLRGSP